MPNHQRHVVSFLWVRSLCLIGCLCWGITPLIAQTDSTGDTFPLIDSVQVDTLIAAVDTLGNDSLSVDSSMMAFGDSLSQGALASPQSQRQQQIKDSLKAVSDLSSQVAYKAQDSIVFDVRNNKIYLYNQTDLTFEDFNLKSARMEVDISQQELFAEGVVDENGNRSGTPVFKQGEESYQARTMAYNFNSGKARVTRGRIVQEDIYVQADVAKYQPDGSFHGADGKFTTCDLEHPHFYIEAKRLKMLPSKQIITGPLRPVIADFPLPIYLPFGFIPGNLAQKGRKRGIIQPQYGNADDQGFFLRGLGYYFPINDYFDLAIEGDIYTRGGWRLGATTNYRVRYKYSGSLNLQYGVTRFNERTDPDFSRATEWTIRWSHNQPIDPTARFNASVDIRSSQDSRRINVNDPGYFDNNLGSSIALQKQFNNLPFSFNLSAQHRQDLSARTLSIDLPSVTFNMNRISPFRNVAGRNMNFLKQLGVTYNMQARNSLASIGDSLFLPIVQNLSSPLVDANGDTIFFDVGTAETPDLITRTGQSFLSNGMQHSTSASTTAKIFDYVNLSPSFSYRENWYLETIRQTWNPDLQEVEETTVSGFARAYEFNGSVSANTNFYGIYQLPRTKRQITFRQRFSPSVGYTIRPDFSDDRWGFYRDVQTDTLGNTQRYSIFEDGIYGGPGRGESQSVSFSLGSVLEMKYKTKEAMEPDFEGDDPFERITVIDNLSLSSSYNLAADSFQLAPFNVRARANLFNRKLSLNTSATLDPYFFGYEEVEEPFALSNPRRFDIFLVEETGQLARMTQAQISLSTSFNGKQDRERGKANDFDETQFQEAQRNYSQYVDFTIPWSLNLRYNLSYRKPGLDATVTSTVNLQGDVRFGSKWKIQYTTGYDLVNQEFTNTTFSVSRDLHCWQMSFRWIPFGPRKSYSLVISARSPTLSALRLNRNEFWTDRFQ